MKTKLTSVQYLGYTAMDRRFSTPMLPWLLQEIKKLATRDKLSLAVEGGCLKAYNENFEPVLVHSLSDVIRKSQVAGSPEQFFYIVWSERDKLLQCFLFCAATVHDVTELFSQMREPSPSGAAAAAAVGSLAVTRNAGFQRDAAGSAEHLPWNTAPALSLPSNCHLSSMPESPLVRTSSNASVLASLSADLSPSDSHFFEVLYIGKVRVSQRKVPDSLIDDALQKFSQHESDKTRQAQMRRNSLLSSQAVRSFDKKSTISSNPGSTEDITEDKFVDPLSSQESSVNQNIRVNVTLSCTSTTPLEPDKSFQWKSEENLRPETPRNSPEIDQEFDNFTKERVGKSNGNNHIKKPIPVALEPNILILNVPTTKNSLTTLTEDENEGFSTKSDDIGSIISDTASSITQFCQESYRKDLTPTKDVPIKKKENIRDLDAIEACPPEEYNKIDLGKFARTDSEESNVIFDELKRKPKVLQRSKTGLNGLENRKSSLPENKPFLRDRSASIGTLNLNKTPIAQLIGEQNRTMLFQIGRSELRLISPDRKQILLHKAFRDVASCVLGRGNRDHFGFICREANTDAYVCYVFKCASDSVATEVINAIKQAFTSHAETVKKSRERSPNMTCEHCPMLWYHRLCHDVEGMNEKKTHAFILRRIEQLPEEEQDQIITKYQGGTNHMYEPTEHNAFLMMLLRAHSEAKQLRHVHDTAENRSEFLNQYLGGSTIFMKARRSLTSGFDHLLKRKASKDDLGYHAAPVHIKKEASPLPVQDTSSEPSVGGQYLSPELVRSKSMSPAITVTGGDMPDSASVTNDTNGGGAAERSDEEPRTPQDTVSGSPMMDIFLKVGDTKSVAEGGGGGAGDVGGATWRQAIFQRVVSPAGAEAAVEEMSPASLLGLPAAAATGEAGGVRARRSRDQLRELWRMAIGQTVLLVRMEWENARLRESEESSAVRRIKLEYTELGAAGAPPVWDALLSARERSATLAKQDPHMLKQCVRQGVPRMCRGGVWYYLAEQHCLRAPAPDPKKFPMYNVPYHTLLSGLTMHQHAILIDLGRTFPQHSYFASALGPGQLALYNLLKAYSLLDPEVGYCQGLSFVAGVLLLHMEEAEAFILLRHLMFRRGLRKQYLPDMSALQIQLYQLSRLLRDHEPELHAKLEQLDIAPALYAAPWMLTLFTSQFPLGFVVRVFDLIFLESLDVVFAVSLALLSAHKDGLMLCESCEEAAEYLKHKLPDVDKTIYDKVMKKVYSLDISRQLAEYAVEYGVLREEMPRIALLSSLQDDYQQLERENQKVMSELDSAMESISTYQSSQSRLEAQVRSLEQQLGLMSRYLLAHHDRKSELPGEIKRICHNHNKKVGFGSKITTFSSKFSNNEQAEEEEEGKTKSILKTGMSTPNLFAKLTKDEVANIRDNSKVSLEGDRRKISPMKKSMSVNSGLVAPPVKKTVKVVEDKSDENQYKRSNSIRMDDPIRDTLKDIGKKNSGFFANSHEHIRQERMFAQQLKNDFDENLKRLDQKLSPNRSYIDNIAMFQGQKSMSLNLDRKIIHQNSKNLEKTNHIDSGFATPMSPMEDKKDDDCSIISHPLSDCDVDIKFDGHSTQLKCLRPILKPNILENRSNSFESQESKQTI